MATISIDNGQSFVDVRVLNHGQVLHACEVACAKADHAYEEVDGQTHANEREWLIAYCDAHENYHGEAFVVG